MQGYKINYRIGKFDIRGGTERAWIVQLQEEKAQKEYKYVYAYKHLLRGVKKTDSTEISSDKK